MSGWWVFAAAYGVGSIPTAYLAGIWCKGVDIRRHGSGNVGSTNAVRVLGKKIGWVVFAVDLCKGLFPVMLWTATSGIDDPQLARVLLALSAVGGHVFTPFLGFRGGKGIATGSGALLGGFPPLFALCAVVWVLVYLPTRIVSVSSLAGLAAMALAVVFADYSAQVKALFFFMFVLLTFTHRSNLARLLKGQEQPFRKS